MGFKVERKPFKIGSSMAVTLPPAWCTYYGDRIATLTLIGNTVLVVAPQGLETQALEIIERIEQNSENT